MNYFTRPLMADERKYTFRSCTDIEVRSGFIGQMIIDMSSTFSKANKTWYPFNKRLETNDFQSDFNSILSVIGMNFSDKDKLRVYFNTHYSLTFSDGTNNYAGIKISTNKYCYLIRINPSGNTKSISAFCYLQDRLKNHMRNATKGIHFVNKDNEELVTISDGGSIVIHPCSMHTPIVCRYIDPFTCRIGSKIWNLRDFADYLMKKGLIISSATD